MLPVSNKYDVLNYDRVGRNVKLSIFCVHQNIFASIYVKGNPFIQFTVFHCSEKSISLEMMPHELQFILFCQKCS